MPSTGYVSTLEFGPADGAALTNTVTATSIAPVLARAALPAGFFTFPGQQVRLRATGRISTVVTTPGNLTLDFRLGTIATPIIVWNGGATALNIIAQVNSTWDLEVLLTVRAVGSGTSANLIGVGKWTSRASLNNPAVATTTGVGTVLMPDTAPAVGTGFDSTITNIPDLFATFSVNNASNSIQCHQFGLESLN